MHGHLRGSICEDQPEGLRAGQGGPDGTWEVTRRTLRNGQEAGYLLGVIGHGVHLLPREDGEMPGEDPLLSQSRPLTAWADLPSHPVSFPLHSHGTPLPLHPPCRRPGCADSAPAAPQGMSFLPLSPGRLPPSEKKLISSPSRDKTMPPLAAPPPVPTCHCHRLPCPVRCLLSLSVPDGGPAHCGRVGLTSPSPPDPGVTRHSACSTRLAPRGTELENTV